MPVAERIPLQRAVAVISADAIAVRPSRAQLVGPLIQGAIAGGAVASIVLFLEAVPLWLLMVLLLVAIIFGPVSALGLVYNVYGSEFLIERHKQSARWQQGFLGLGIGTAELAPFWRIDRVEVVSDFEAELTSGQEQDFVQFEVRLVKDNGRELEVGAVAVARPFAGEGLERANRLASHIAEMIGQPAALATLPTLDLAAPATAAEERPRRTRRRRRPAPPPREA